MDQGVASMPVTKLKQTRPALRVRDVAPEAGRARGGTSPSATGQTGAGPARCASFTVTSTSHSTTCGLLLATCRCWHRELDNIFLSRLVSLANKQGALFSPHLGVAQLHPGKKRLEQKGMNFHCACRGARLDQAHAQAVLIVELDCLPNAQAFEGTLPFGAVGHLKGTSRSRSR